MRARVHQIATFTNRPFSGNPAFVLGLDDELPTDILRQIAGQLGGSVLAVLGPLQRLRFCTPEGVHPGAGHSAIAAAHVALRDRDEAELELDDGTRRRFWREDDRIMVPWPTMPCEAIASEAALGAALGVTPDRCLVGAFGYVAIYADDAVVRDMAPDLAAVAALDRNAIIVTAPGEQSDIVVRVFAPNLGLPEDPVCGTAHRMIVPYWAERLGQTSIHSRHLSPRGGDLWCRVAGDVVIIGGQACSFLEGEIEVPAAVSGSPLPIAPRLRR